LKVFHPIGAWVLVGIAAVAAAQGQKGTRQQALALEQENRNAEAEAMWQSIAEATPRNAEAYAHMGLLEARQNTMTRRRPITARRRRSIRHCLDWS
jgi:hypothetical protein